MLKDRNAYYLQNRFPALAHLSVKLDLTEIKLRLGDEESAKRIMRQQLDNQAERSRVGGPRGNLILDPYCQDVTQNTLPCVATRPYREFAYAYAKFCTTFFIVIIVIIIIIIIIIYAAAGSTTVMQLLLMI
jgi:hypothetical protein